MFKFSPIFFASLLLIAACGGGSEGNQAESATTALSVKGSDTVLPLTQKEAEEFMKIHPEASITVVGGGSGTGITALMDGSTDICMSSRDMKVSERMSFTEKNMDIKEVVVGFDALSVIVHPDNPVSQLTREQLEDIFTGKTTNWKDVGGSDAPIIAYSRESSSGTYEFFKEHVMDKKNYASTVLNMPATGAIVQSVSQTAGAIGYIGLGYMTPSVKALSVSYDGGKNFTPPSVEGAKDKSYPIARPLYYFYDTVKQDQVAEFVAFILSAEGQKHVAEIGYVPVN